MHPTRLFSIVGFAALLAPSGAAWAASADPAPRETDRSAIHRPVSSIPSFSRQTGLACSVCHTAFPRLTQFGREFKLNGYTFDAEETIGGTTEGQPGLALPRIPGLSAMLQVSGTATSRTIPGSQNGNVELPQELGFFYAGSLASKLGAFLQLTYAPEDGGIGIDNADVRLATQATLFGKPTVFGATVNNNPGVQDVWNTLPAWNYPFISSATAPTPTAGPLLDEALAQVVGGLGGYAYWNRTIYGEVSVYRSAPQGSANPPDATSQMTTKGVAPYWRLTVQRSSDTQTLMIGTYGMRADLFPSGVGGATDRYTDVGLDAQYERHVGPGNFTGQTTWLWEHRTLDASLEAGNAAGRRSTLRTYRLDANYYLDRGIGLTLGFMSLSGDRDALLYAPGEVVGSRNAKPDSRAYLAQVDFDAWLNTRIGIQYTFYDRFNGSRTNYDGFGRRAQDNDSLFVFAWLAF